MRRREFLQAAGAGAASLAGASAAAARRGPAVVAPEVRWPEEGGARERLSLDGGWRFLAGEAPKPAAGPDPTYDSSKTGKAGGAAAIKFDDAAWRLVDLPHDFVVEQPFDKDAGSDEGYRRRGVGWYRRGFRLDPADRGKHLELQFDGIATRAEIWVNGTPLAHNFSAYDGVTIDLTPLARFGDEPNVIAVRADATANEGWWYEGGGIYRHVWLVKRPTTHLVTNGVYAVPRKTDDGWRIPVEVDTANVGEGFAAAKVQVELLDGGGAVLDRADGEVSLAPLGRARLQLTLRLAQPKLWSPDDPVLYRVRTRLTEAGGAVDEVSTPCGFRSFRWDAERGFFLNDQPLKIKGVCAHQDHAGVGVAVPDALWAWRLARIKEMGANAYRCSHNAPAKALLDAADRLGVLVMDENRNFSPGADGLAQLAWLVRRDRNHPSVFLWSLFNEEPLQNGEAGYEIARRQAALVKGLDDTRALTAAMNGGMLTPRNAAQALDVVGFNYHQYEYDRFHAEHPGRPMISSEDTSVFGTRGAWADDPAAHVIADDDESAPKWGATARRSWAEIEKRPFVAGGFTWTAFDYRGEPTPYDWPSVSSFFGAMDLCGFPKFGFYLRRAQWIANQPVLRLAPHWTWPGREGQPIKVMALTNAERVRLSLNGRLIGEALVGPDRTASWQVAYAPGRLEAEAIRGGRVVAREAAETAGPATRLSLTPARPQMAGDGWDAQPVSVTTLDARGRSVPAAGQLVTFEVAGGRMLGHGNGDPNSHEDEKGPTRRLFNGWAQLIVQSLPGSAGPLRVRASAPGLASAEATILVRTAAPPFRPA